MIVLALVLAPVAHAQEHQPTAHVVSAVSGRHTEAHVCIYELRVDNLTYVAAGKAGAVLNQNVGKCNPNIVVGSDLAAKINGKKITVEAGGKKISLEIMGSHE